MAPVFRWRHFAPEVILLCVRGYSKYGISYRELEERMTERGIAVDHTTLYRRVQRYAPKLEKRLRPALVLETTVDVAQLAGRRGLCEGQGQVGLFLSGR